MAEDITAEGSIAAFSQSTEKSIIRRLAAESADHENAAGQQRQMLYLR
ncbi:MAG: hypothetical protein OES20_19155 [Gammaproteobacteria bacterium]|nr:hypothetical protein [Gammaproteobacteria bacterium]